MRQEACRRYIYVVMVLALAIRVAYAVITPPFQAPDEYSHYSYVRYVHDSRELPVQSSTTVRPEELQFHQPPLYYTLASTLFPSTNLIEDRQALPLRGINIVLAMLTIWVAYQFALTVWPNNPFNVALISTCVAFLPTYSYISATIRNGVLATFLCSLGFYFCAKAFGKSDGWDSRWGWIGIIGGLAVISKLTAIGFVAGTGLAILVTAQSWRMLVRRAGWFGLGFLLVAGWWFARNWLVYGHPVMVVETGFQSAHAGMDFLPHLRSMWIVIFKTFWAVFGRINEIYFQDIYRFFWWFSGIAFLGLIRYAAQRRHDISTGLMTCLTGAIAASFALTTYYAYNYDSDQGRYLFPVLIPIATFITVGFGALVPSRYHQWALYSVLIALAGVNMLVLYRMATIYG